MRSAGIDPRSPQPQEPNFDLGWTIDGTVFVAEVKSITNENEEGQLRLGLGQVLRYRHALENLGHPYVRAVLVPEREPSDPSWRELCDKVGVTMLSRDELVTNREHPALAIGCQNLTLTCTSAAKR